MFKKLFAGLYKSKRPDERITRIVAGQPAPVFEAYDVLKNKVSLQQFKGRKVYLAFLRNTDCPICNYHVYRLVKLSKQWKENCMEVFIFYETKSSEIRKDSFYSEVVLGDTSLRLISDSNRITYSLYHVELNAEKATMEAMEKNGRLPIIAEARKVGFHGDGIQPDTHVEAVPAGFLLDENHIVRRAHYGEDAGDPMPLEWIDAFAKGNDTITV